MTWENVVLSSVFILRLEKLLTHEDNRTFSQQLRKIGIDPMAVEGMTAFETLVQCIEDSCADTSHLIRRDAGSKKHEERAKRATHHVDVDTPVTQVTESNIPVNVQNVPICQTTTSNFLKPCPLRGHNHSVGMCADFLSISPVKRRQFSEQRLCWTCLGPRQLCRIKTSNPNIFLCKNTDSINPTVLCPKCTEYIKTNNKPYSPCNVLMCTIKSHSTSLPSLTELKSPLKELLGTVDFSKLVISGGAGGNVSLIIDNAGQKLQQDQIITAHQTSSGSGSPVTVNSSSGEIKNLTNEK